jgi:hypothetical protein
MQLLHGTYAILIKQDGCSNQIQQKKIKIYFDENQVHTVTT